LRTPSSRAIKSGTRICKPLSRVAPFQVLSCCECTGGAVSATRASTTAGKTMLMGRPSKNSTGSFISGFRNLSAGPRIARGISTSFRIHERAIVRVAVQKLHRLPLQFQLFQTLVGAEMVLPDPARLCVTQLGSHHTARLPGSGLELRL